MSLNLTEYSILIADDERGIAEMLEEELQEAGFKTRTCFSGNQAIELMQNEAFQVIITDVRMPDGSGVDILNYLNTLSKDQRPVLYFVTGQSDISKEEALDQGVNGFITKPFDLMAISDMIKEDLKNWKT
jgi:DNA-binding response OmpR family regulator